MLLSAMPQGQEDGGDDHMAQAQSGHTSLLLRTHWSELGTWAQT